MDWLDLLAVQGTLKSLLQHHSSKASVLRRSAFFTVQLSHPYMTTGKTIALTRWTFVGKVISLLIIREMQIKTTMRYHLPSLRMAVIKKIEYSKCWWWCREKGIIFCTLGGNANLCSCYGKQHGVSSTIKNRTTIWFKNPFSGYIPKTWNQDFEGICTSIFIATLFTMVKIQTI